MFFKAFSSLLLVTHHAMGRIADHTWFGMNVLVTSFFAFFHTIRGAICFQMFLFFHFTYLGFSAATLPSQPPRNHVLLEEMLSSHKFTRIWFILSSSKSYYDSAYSRSYRDKKG